MPGVPHTIASMPTFSGVPFFGMDEMHLIGEGISKLVYSLLNPLKNKDFRGQSGYSFELSGRPARTTIMANIIKYIGLSKATVPPSFEGRWDGHFEKYRSVDWEDFFSVAVPCIFLQYIANDLAKIKLMAVVNGCNRSMDREISLLDINKIKR